MAKLEKVTLSMFVFLQLNWSAGVQCVTKCDNRKPKSGELEYRKGHILTIIDTSMVFKIFIISVQKLDYRAS